MQNTGGLKYPPPPPYRDTFPQASTSVAHLYPPLLSTPHPSPWTFSTPRPVSLQQQLHAGQL